MLAFDCLYSFAGCFGHFGADEGSLSLICCYWLVLTVLLQRRLPSFRSDCQWVRSIAWFPLCWPHLICFSPANFHRSYPHCRELFGSHHINCDATARKVGLFVGRCSSSATSMSDRRPRCTGYFKILGSYSEASHWRTAHCCSVLPSVRRRSPRLQGLHPQPIHCLRPS